ncbi:MAG: ABC transporter permease subunit [Chloroflexi bacterium]|nr:ABC transporter permease subunit [Chloroflexota bacterium]
MGNRGLLTVILVGAFLWSLLNVNWGEPLLHDGGLAAAARLLGAMLRPDLAPDLLYLGLVASWRTLAYATAGVTLAFALALPTGILASGVLVRQPRLRLITATACRAFLGSLRAIHELVWAWLLVAALGLSPLAAVLALALPYAGILGRILAEMLHDVPEAPLRSLRSSGASEWQVLLYGRLPLVWPDLASYALYRFECGIRSAAIMSFVGLGGLGYQIQISLDDLNYAQVWTFVYFLVALVVLVDAWSSLIRTRLVA